jgi:DNA mismatch repair protein MutL
MASVREALGRFNIGPSLDFENEALIEIPVRSSSDKITGFPSIEINPKYDPFADDDRTSNQDKIIERFEQENTTSWEKLFSSLERESGGPQRVEPERKFFQIKNKYIVCSVKSGLMLIDQKRAHERILFERFLENLSDNRAFIQSEMFPVNIELNPADIFVLKEIEDYIRLLGFSIKYSGKNIISIIGRPSGSGPSDPAELIEILLEEYKRTQSDPSTGVKEKVAAAMAGASAIPYGKILLKNEMEDIFDALFACKAPNYSPKGKPVINILTLEEIDKRFK